ncbi:MAG: IS3 family transposase [Gammaproteobacteria bacterium]|nr:IS3 family transposase [Gammaproteobacteria bacterium]
MIVGLMLLLKLLRKQELVHWRSYRARSEAQKDKWNYISVFYNNYRLHSILGYMSSGNFEKQIMGMKKTA